MITLQRYIILPNTSTTNIKKKTLKNPGIKAISNALKTIRSLINNENNNTYIQSRTGLYEIPCLDCN